MRILARFVVVSLAATCSAPVMATWHKASSPHFVIYSEQDPKSLQAYATKLEKFDQAVRYARGVPDDVPAPVNRLKVFVTKDLESLQRIYGMGKAYGGVAGFYLSRGTGTVAYVPLDSGAISRTDLSADTIFFHEYSHHLMLQSAHAAYPAWLVEGFAEFFATAKFEPDGSVGLGAPALHRAGMLLGNWTRLPLDMMLAPRKGPMYGVQFAQMYGRGWLLLHYLTFKPERKGQLENYILQIQKGVPALTAAKTAFGSLPKLDGELRQYVRSTKFAYVTVPESKLNIGKIDVTPLTAGEDAMMPVILRSTRGVDKKLAAIVATDARRIAASYPNDPSVQLALAEAEIDDKKYDAAEAAADRALKLNPKLGDAMVFKGRAMMERAEDQKKAVDLKPIRAMFIAANKLNPDDPEPLIYYAETFRRTGQPMTKNAAAGLTFAMGVAPHDFDLRWKTAAALLAVGSEADARLALNPIAQNPHSTKSSEKADKVLEMLDAGNRSGASALLGEELYPVDKDGKKKDDDE